MAHRFRWVLVAAACVALAPATRGELPDPPFSWNPLQAADVRRIDPAALLEKSAGDIGLKARFETSFRHTGPARRREFLQRVKAAALHAEDPRVGRALEVFAAELDLLPHFQLRTFGFEKVDRKELLAIAHQMGIFVYRAEADGWVSRSNHRLVLLGTTERLDELARIFRAARPTVETIDRVRLEVRFGTRGQERVEAVTDGPDAPPGLLDPWTALGHVDRLRKDPAGTVAALLRSGALPRGPDGTPALGTVTWRLLAPGRDEPLAEG